MSVFRTTRVSGGLLLTLALSLVATRSDAGNVGVIEALDPARAQFPESITIDRDGRILLSMAAAVWTLIPDGRHAPVKLASLPVPAGAVSAGVKVGPDGDVYVCTAAFDPAIDAAHVWRISPSGAVADFTHFEADAFPNDLAFDDEGNLFVTDPSLGLVYRIDREGRSIVWLGDPRLLGNVDDPPSPLGAFGADGIAFDARDRNLYIGNADFGEILRVPLGDDGEPGALDLFASDPRLVGADGIAFDDHRHLYVAVNTQSQIAEIDCDGRVALVAQGAPLDNPSSLVFGIGPRTKKMLYISSFSLAKALGLEPGTPDPSLDAIAVPFAGLRLLDDGSDD